MSNIAVQTLLDEVGASLRALREGKTRFAALLAPDFRIFDYLRDSEMGVSQCIADLLKPDGKHGQGRLFLDSFLEFIEWKTSVTNCKVIVEKQANGRRRIDIYLKFDEGLIGIENKPWATDQKNQLHDYAAYLNKTALTREWKLVYFCNEEPTEDSITNEQLSQIKNQNKFKHLNFHEIVDWLEYCGSKTKAPVVRIYIEELSKFIRKHINRDTDMDEQLELVKIIESKNEYLENSFEIANSIFALQKSLLLKFKEQLTNEVKNEIFIEIVENLDWNTKGDKWWNVSDSIKNSGFTLWIHTKKFGKLALRFAFENTGYKNFYWGITSFAEARPNRDSMQSIQVFEILKSRFMKNETLRTDHWSFWEWPAADVSWTRNWDNKATPWIAIKNNLLAQEIIDFSKNVIECLDSQENTDIL